jgi:hypothetical protein
MVGFASVLRIWIRDPLPFYLWNRDPGWKKSGFGINIPDHNFESLVRIFVKNTKFFVADPVPWWIRYPGWKMFYPGSGINIRDPQHCFVHAGN